MTENLFTLPQQPNLYLYNKYRQPIKPNQLPTNLTPPPFYFFGSGSRGNSVYLTRIHSLIDLGFSYKHYTDIQPNFFSDVDYLFLTHEHRDHFQFATFYRILRQFPQIKIIISRRMFNTITNPNPVTNPIRKTISGDFSAKVCQLQTEFKTRFLIVNADQNSALLLTTRKHQDFWFTPHLVSHGNIYNLALELTVIKSQMHTLYTSDLNHLIDNTGNDQIKHLGLPLNYSSNENIWQPDFIPHPNALTIRPLVNPFDLLFLEANYDQAKLDAALQLNPTDPHALGNLRHISEQAAWQYVNLALQPRGIFIPLHASDTFGTLKQNLTSERIHH